jgi:hypothetical protein
MRRNTAAISSLLLYSLSVPIATLASDNTRSTPDNAAAVQREKPPAACLYRMAEDFVPMTRSERVPEAVASVAGGNPFVFSAISAAIGQGYGRPREWGQGAEGFGLRYGSGYAQYFLSQIFEQGTAYMLHEDNRFFGSGERSAGRRLRYAVASALLARHDDGSRSVSISAIGGAAGAAFLSRAWQPRSTTSAGDGAESFGLTMAARIGVNILREFSPRIFGRILR